MTSRLPEAGQQISRRIRRVVVCDDPRVVYLKPRVLPEHHHEGIARRFGDALGLPYAVVTAPIEECRDTDFIFVDGYWPTGERSQDIAARTADLCGTGGRDYAASLDASGLAFSIPSSEQGGSRRGGAALIYARTEIARAAGLEVFERIFAAEHYVAALSPPGMTQAEMVARYLRTYWDVLGY